MFVELYGVPEAHYGYFFGANAVPGVLHAAPTRAGAAHLVKEYPFMSLRERLSGRGAALEFSAPG